MIIFILKIHRFSFADYMYVRHEKFNHAQWYLKWNLLNNLQSKDYKITVDFIVYVKLDNYI